MSKKKRKIFIGLIVCIIILIVILIAIISIRPNITVKNKIKKDIESTLSCIINNDFSNGFYYMNINGYTLNSINMTEFDKKVANKVKFKVLDIETKNNEAIVKVEMEYPNLAKQLETLKSSNFTIDSFDFNSADNIKKEIDVYLIKNNGHWILLQSQEIMDVFSGGLSTVYSNSEKEAYEKLLEAIK